MSECPRYLLWYSKELCQGCEKDTEVGCKAKNCIKQSKGTGEQT